MISDSLINIENLVKTTFENALKNDDIIFQGFQITEQFIDGCSYQIRYVPGLDKKPVRDDVEKSGKDVLSPPYGNLHVCDILNYGLNQTTYAVLLNKYPLTKNHFLLLPHDFAKQSDVLSSDDLTLIYEILQNYKTTKLIAFFNCGEESGASQKHKHIQFCPIEENEPPIEIYLQDENQYEQANQLIQVPWAHFVISLLHPPEQLDQLGNYLMNKFIQLLDKMFHFKQGKHFDGAKSSYNVLITKKYIHLIPRSKEIFLLSNHSKKSVGGTDYAGIMNIKEEHDINTILNIGFTNILLDVGRKKD